MTSTDHRVIILGLDLGNHPRIGLRGMIVACMLVLAIVPSVIILPMLANLSRSITQRQAAATLQTTTQAVAEQLAGDLRGQWAEVKRLAAFAEKDDDDKLRNRLDTIVATNAQYAWLGLADPAGKVLVASDGVLGGADVSARPWFKAGLAGDFAGDVHDALLLQKVLEPNAREPLRLIDFALPVKRGDGVPVGVLGAHVRWQTVRDLFARPRGEGGSIEVMLLAQDGTVLVGPAALEGKRLPLASVQAAGQGIARTSVESWGDGQSYLTTALPALAVKDVPSFGWSVVGRQPVALALSDTYAAAARMLPVIAACGVFIVVAAFIFGWWVARPLTRLAQAADAMADGASRAPVPHERLYIEASVLSDALARLDSQQDKSKP
jgi:HAMP domain-containing protein